MKNIFRIVMAVAILFTASCAKEDISSSIGGGEVEVTFTADLGQLGTRAYGEAKNVDRVYLGVYEAGEKTPLELVDYQKGYPVSNGKASITVVLLKDKKYDLVFWAQNNAQTCYARNWDDRSITVDYTGVKSQDDLRDAFFLVENDFWAGHDETTFELRRPFAQLRAAISKKDQDYIEKNGSEILTSKVEVKGVANVIELNTENAEVYGDQTVTFDVAAIPANEDKFIEVNGVQYQQLSMNYILVREKKLVDVTYTFADDNTNYTRPYYNVPIQRNYRTNILGQLISSPMDFTVIINPEFEGEHNDVWDGQTVSEPAFDDATQTYTVVKPSELAWLAAAVNGTLETRAVAADSFKGKTFVLAEDIDLGYKEWTPIGNANSNFQGTFDGNGKTISSLYINTPSKSNVGLFGMTTDGEIKNLTVKNAKVTGRLNVGVVAGTPYTSKYTDITVTGLIEVNGMAYVGAVGGKNAYANWTNITVNAAKGSYVKANSVENDTAYRTYVGGVVGFNGEGGHSFTNIKSNINVEGSTCDVGGLFGIAHYGNKFVDCSCSGNVAITNAAEAEEAEEIGGIAGVWNNGGADVVMTNCTFTGNLSANVAATVWYGGLVGKPYSESGNGKLVIDGQTFDKGGVNFGEINKALADGDDYTLPFDLEGAAIEGGYTKAGIVINGQTVDGAGHTLTVNDANGTWDCAVYHTGGTLKNITVAGAFRGVFTAGTNSDIIIDNVIFKDVIYTFNSDDGNKNYGVYISNSTLNGWTSHSDVHKEVVYTNCSFGEGCGYKFCRPYGPTTFVRCNFCEGYEIDPQTEIVLVDCTLNGVAITAENLANIVADTTKVKFAPVVNNIDALKEALATETYVKVAAGNYTFPASSIKAGATIECAEGTVFTGASSLNIKGATVIGATFSNPNGNAVGSTINGTFRNCTFTGSNALRYTYAGETVVFENCVFDGSTYGIHFDGGANDVIFRNCTISGFNGLGAELTLVTFENCTFVGNGKSGYNGANLWGSAKLVNCEFTFNGTTANEWIDCIGADKAYEFTNCKVNGVAYTAENRADYNIFSRNNTTVKINGVDCQM